MLGEFFEKPFFISGKISQIDDISATILLENGQKIFWPKKFLSLGLTIGSLIKMRMDSAAAQTANEGGDGKKGVDAKKFLNSLLREA